VIKYIQKTKKIVCGKSSESGSKRRNCITVFLKKKKRLVLGITAILLSKKIRMRNGSFQGSIFMAIWNFVFGFGKHFVSETIRVSSIRMQ
jgi:hypothetical protein